jgi:uncharacterized membrane protein YfcA
VSFVGGILGGAALLSRIVPSMWCAVQPWTKAEQRAVMQPFNIAIVAIAAAVFFASGYCSLKSISLIVVVLPTTLLFAQIGIWAFNQLTDEQFRKLLVGLLVVFGIGMITKEALSR